MRLRLFGLGDTALNLQLLKSFLAVAECRNFTKAAQFLNFTQPAISSHITALEKLYGVVLFQRDGKNVYLTDAGIAFRESAEKIVGAYDRSQKTMTAFRQKKTFLRIAVSTQFINHFLMDVLYELHQKFPDLMLEVHRCMTVDTTIKDTFVDRIYDFAFVHLDVHPLYTKRQLLWKQKIVWAVNRDLFESHGRSAQIEEYPVIFYPQTSVYYKLSEKFGFSNLASAFTYSDSDTIKLAVKKGLGAAFLPEIKIKEELQSGEFALVAPEKSLELPISLLYRQNMEITPQMKFLFNLLKKYAKTV